MAVEEQHPAAAYYRWQLFSTLGWWLLVFIASGKPLHEVVYGSVATRPSWLGANAMHRLHSSTTRKYIFLAPLVALAAGGLSHYVQSSFLARAGIAIVVSLYHLLETSTTCRHGEVILERWRALLVSHRTSNLHSFVCP